MTYLTAAVIVKDEEDYILEWLYFHMEQGVERFLVMDNVGSRPLRRILRPLERSGVVETIVVKGRQVPAYGTALATMKGRTRWLAVIDADEFLFAPNSESLPTVLREFEEHPGVGVNWVLYGDSGHVVAPGGLVIEKFVERGAMDHRIRYPHLLLPGGNPDDLLSYRPMNSHIKSIIQPELTLRCLSPHHFEYEGGRCAVSETGTPISSPWTDTISVERLRINHYWSKSQQELERRISRGRVDNGRQRNPAEARLRLEATRGILDYSALPHVDAVRRRMNRHGR